jgi:hypothetical protein
MRRGGSSRGLAKPRFGLGTLAIAVAVFAFLEVLCRK